MVRFHLVPVRLQRELNAAEKEKAMLKGSYTGRIDKVVTDQSNPYAIAYCEKEIVGDTVFIPLDDGWTNSDIQPQKGMIVVLEGVFLTQKGWRAKSARPVTPEDQRVIDAAMV